MVNCDDIFHKARQLSGEEREQYLTEACGNDLSLRNKVDALLAADVDAGSFMAEATNEYGSDRSAATVVQAVSTEQAGHVIDRYKLLQQIGEGGFGTVWMAEQQEPIKRRVALKIIKLGMDTKQVIARFEAERQALAMLDHTNIAKVLDAGATDTGRPYFVMELVKGIPILEYCDEERLDTRARLNLFKQVCHAIQHAHQKGIIHRDIKPSNVLVTLHGEDAVVKVIDFGIAKATNAELTQKTYFTEHRQMIGTPAYMSPEQAAMSGLDIDTRSDVYSLGVLLYEILTGTTPFDTKNLMNQGFAEMMRIIREQEPHKPSTRLSTLGETGTRTAQLRRTDPKRLRMMLRGDLDWIVMKCLEKDRSRRYETANGLSADIERHLTGEPVVAAPPSRAYRIRKFIQRNKAQVAVGFVITMLLVLCIIGTSLGMAWALSEKRRADLLAETEAAARAEAVTEAERAEGERRRADAERVIAEESRRDAEKARDLAEAAQRKAEAERKRAEEATKRARAEAQTSQAITDFTLNLLSLANPDVSRSPNITIREILDLAGDDIRVTLDNQPRAEIEIRTAIAHAFHVMGYNEDAEVHIERVLLLLDTLPDVTPADRWEPLLVNLFLEVDRAVVPWHAQLREFWDNLELVIIGRRPDLGDLIHEMRQLAQDAGSHARAVRLLEQLMDVVSDTNDGDLSVYVANHLHACGYWWERTGQSEPAIEHLERAVDLYLTTRFANQTYTTRAISYLALTYTNTGEVEAAIDLLKKQRDRMKHVLPRDHPLIRELSFTLGLALTDAGNYDKAEPLILTAAEQALKHFDQQSAHHQGALHAKIKFFERSDQWDRIGTLREELAESLARRKWIRSRRVTDDAFPVEYHDFLAALDTIEQVQSADMPLDIALVERLIETRQKIPSHTPLAAVAADRLRVVAHQIPTDEPELAERLYREVVRTMRDNPYVHDAKYGRSLFYLARNQWRQWNDQEALALARRALLILEQWHGEQYSRVLDAHRLIGTVLTERQNFVEAEEHLIRSYQGRMKASGDGHFRTIDSVRNLFALYSYWQGAAAADRFLDRVMPNHLDSPDISPTSLRNVVRDISRLSDLSAQSYEFGLAAAERAYEMEPDHPTSAHALGRVMLRLGRYAEAIEALEDAMEDGEPRMVDDLGYLALAHHHIGNTAKAMAAFDRFQQRRSDPRGYLRTQFVEEVEETFRHLMPNP